MNSARKAKVPRILKIFRCRAEAWLLLGLLVAVFPARAWDGGDGVLWVCAWDGPDSEILEPHRDGSWLLSYTEDFAVLLFREDPSFPPRDLERWSRLGNVDVSGDYYLYVLPHAGRVRFAPPSRVLFRRGHTAFLWTPGAIPEPERDSREALPGPVRSILVDIQPKPLPARGATVEKEQPPPFDILVDGIVDDVLEDEYVRRWQWLDDYETRYTLTEQNEAATEWIADVFASYGLDVEFHEFEQEGIKRNVIATLPGAADPSRIVYMTAHFDSKSEDSFNHAPGADDNASGTAALLEAARVLSRYPFRYTIRFAAFNGEEQGIRGSLAYVRDIVEQGEDVVGCFNLDMIAYRGNDPDPANVVVYSNEQSVQHAETFRDACLRYFPEDLEPLVVEWALGISDHQRFWLHGYEAVWIVEDEVIVNGEFPGPEFCPWIHTSEDRIERYPRDYPTRVTAAVIAAVAQTARPRTATALPDPNQPTLLRLLPAHPNPARGRAVLSFHLPEEQRVSLSIHDVSGRRIRSLAMQTLGPGLHTFCWRGLDDQGRPAGTGVYFSKFTNGHRTEAARFVFMD
jgi:hypothetical protein